MKHTRRHSAATYWRRRLLFAGALVVALALVVGGGALVYVHVRLDSIHTHSAAHLTKQSGHGQQPENILLIGNETREGITDPKEISEFGDPQDLSGSLSDVIMVLHLDPATKSASILSIPRDLFVPMPAGSPVGSYQKIDAALNDGVNGPDNLIAAITQDLGIPINHYVELRFDGLQKVVNTLGGIKVDFPEKVYDSDSGLDITKTGCVNLNGAQALALVRARHLQYEPADQSAPYADWAYDPQSDLSRIVRDHTVLKVLAAKAVSQGLTNPIRLNDFIGAVISDITIDPALRNQLVSIAEHYGHIDLGNAPETTLPITTVPDYHYNGYDIGDVDFPVEPQDDAVIRAWDPAALPAAQAPTSVSVYNAAGLPDLASDTAAGLISQGLPAKAVGDLEIAGTPSETLVRYGTDGFAAASAVTRYLSGAVMLQPDAALTAGEVEVDAGSLLATAHKVAATSPSSSAPSSSAPSSSASAQPSATTQPSVPTPDGQKPSSSQDVTQPWDPIPCTA